MRVLVTGSTGPLGRQVVERLLSEGYDVTIVTRRPFAAQGAFAKHDVRLVEWHPLSDPLPPAALDEVEAVITMAGEPFVGAGTAAQQARLGTSRITIAERLGAALLGRQIRVIGVSLLLPPSDGAADTVVTDRAPRSLPKTDLERDLMAADAACHAITSSGAGVAIVRLGVVLAPGPLLATLVGLAERGRVPRFDGAMIPAIAVEDAAALIAGLVGQADITGSLIGVAPEPLAGAALSAALANLRRGPLALPLGQRGLERHLGPITGLLYNRARVVPQRLLDAGAGFQHTDLEATFARCLSTVAGELGSVPRLRTRWRFLPGHKEAPSGQD